MLGNKINPFHSKFLGHKNSFSNKTLGNKIEPKTITAAVYSHSPNPEINNNFNSVKSHLEPHKKYI